MSVRSTLSKLVCPSSSLSSSRSSYTASDTLSCFVTPTLCSPTVESLLVVVCESLQRMLLIGRCVGRYGREAVEPHGVQRQLPLRVVSKIPPRHPRTNRGVAGSEFPRRVRRVRLRDTVAPHLTRPRTPVPVSPSETRTERDCANGQEHHSAKDVGTARTVLGGVPVGRWVLGGIVLRWDGGGCFDRHD